MPKHVYNYSVIRFRPYIETAEFINVGLFFTCPETGYFNFKIERKRSKRVRSFFPEISYKNIFSYGAELLEKELNLSKCIFDKISKDSEHSLSFDIRDRVDLFKNITQPTNNIFCFSEVGTGLCHDPEATFLKLFDDYVHRQFVGDKERHEETMKKKLSQEFKQWGLYRYYEYEKKIGNADYHVTMTFTHKKNEELIKAIRPIDLTFDDSTRIYEKGDTWLQRIKRLKRYSSLPQDVLFVVDLPLNCSRTVQKAANTVVDELIQTNASVFHIAESNSIREFATI